MTEILPILVDMQQPVINGILMVKLMKLGFRMSLDHQDGLKLNTMHYPVS